MPDVLTPKGSVTVPMADGTSRVFNPGDAVNLDDTSGSFREAVEKDGSYTASLFEPHKDSKQKETTGLGAVDTEALRPTELLSRERAGFSEAERFGTSGEDPFPARGSAGRTLPESGADTPANDQFAEGTADTSEDGKDRIALGLPLGDLPEASDAPRGSEDVAEKTKQTPKRGGGKKEKSADDPKGEGLPGDENQG
jgi:hypothetical protein